VRQALGLSHVEDAVLTRTIILMGQGVGLEVIAEGVENTRQLAMLTGQDCALAQGF
jgi:EAL domain-containing protein (putative c-di-GMP-specific phosphodiesterase class I)